MSVRFATPARDWQVEVAGDRLRVMHHGRPAGTVPAGPAGHALDPAALAQLARLGVPVGDLRPESRNGDESDPAGANPDDYLPAPAGEPVECWACHAATLVRRGEWWYEVGTSRRHSCAV